MSRYSWFVAVVALVSAACTAGSEGTGPVTTTTATTTSTSIAVVPPSTLAESSAPATTATTAPAASFAELEQRWSAERQAVVERAVAEDWGVDEENMLRGPGGLLVDLDNCPRGWDPTAGVTAEAVEIAFVGAIDAGLGFFPFSVLTAPERIDRLNERGGIGGRDLSAPFSEDGYMAQFTIEGVNEVLAGDQPLAVATFGGRPSIAAADLLAEACVPHFLPYTNMDALLDGVWSVPTGMTLGAEAALWGEALSGLDRPGTLRVAVVVMDNELGWLMHDAFVHWVDRHPEVVSEIITLPHDPPDPTLQDRITEIVAARPDVVIAATAGNPCVLLAGSSEIAELGLDAAILPNYCTAGSAYLEPAGVTADGWLSIAGFNGGQEVRRVANLAWDDWVDGELAALGFDPTIAAYRAAVDFAWIHEQILLLASELPGGLSRPNLLLAMWAADFEHPSFGPTMRWTVDGPTDPVPIESGILQQWDATADRWIEIRPLSAEGLSPLCEWDGERCEFIETTN